MAPARELDIYSCQTVLDRRDVHAHRDAKACFWTYGRAHGMLSPVDLFDSCAYCGKKLLSELMAFSRFADDNANSNDT